MCGISGIVSLNGRISLKTLEAMTKVIRHRGPDDEGYFLVDRSDEIRLAHGDDSIDALKRQCSHIGSIEGNYNLALGFRRLSIIDTSDKSHQPLYLEDEGLTVIFNGEIYNYIELSNDLKQKGHKFKSEGDTEVVLRAYQEYGDQCVNKFNGMWAFILHDRKQNRLFCSRDRLGVKPFQYCISGGQLFLGSEAKQFLVTNIMDPVPNDEKIYEFLVFSNKTYGKETFFKGIYNLEPGHNMIVDLKAKSIDIAVKIEKYWDLSKTYEADSFSDAKDLLKELFHDSIKLRLRSDVPIGSCLSGGIDSSTIASVIGGQFHVRDWEVYTAAYKDENHTSDERKYSRNINLKYSFKERLIFPDGGKLIESLVKLAWHEEEPFGSASMFAEAEIMKAANHNGIKVLLSGQGGDEALIGYDVQLLSFLIYLLRNGKFKRFLRNYGKLAQNSCLSKTYLAKGLLYYFLPALYYKKVIKTARIIINDGFADNKWNVKNLWGYIKEATTEQDLKRIFIKYTTLPSNLHSEDRNSMSYSIESRTPFVDYRIMEFGYSMPFEYLIEGGWTKAIMREAYQDLVPKEILRRKDKVGFETPESIWLAENRDKIADFFKAGMMAEKYLDKNKVLSILEKQGYETYIWKALIVEAWARAFHISPQND